MPPRPRHTYRGSRGNHQMTRGLQNAWNINAVTANRSRYNWFWAPRSKYMPHQGARERARRVKQMERENQ